MSALFERHRGWLEGAIAAIATRQHFAPFTESPARHHHPDGAKQAGLAAFEARIGKRFAMDLPGQIGWVGEEVSPYTGDPLGIVYPRVDVEVLIAGMQRAWPAWSAASPETRVGVCLQILDRLHRGTFENAFATMHTAGQGFLLAFAGSGASSLDRGLEGLAHAHEAMARIPERATYARRFGPGEPVVLDKRYRIVPVGITAVISCGTYPAWNAWPAIFASLATGNPVVVKPHPEAILPMAIAVESGRAVLAEAGFDPNLLTLAADTRAEPITWTLLEHPAVAIIDFTGSQRFGALIEARCRHAQVYTETAGCNAVVVESTDDPDAMFAAIAHGLCAFSGQMCTAAQNIFVPADGVVVGSARILPGEFERRLVAAVDALLATPGAAGLCGAIQSPTILHTVQHLQAAHADAILRPSGPITQPGYPRARTATPLILRADVADRALYGQEHFGPVSLVITAADREHALRRAAEDAREHGAIACYAYSVDPDFCDRIEDVFAAAGASVGINLRRQLPINYTAGYSDFHVTGLNPAGSATLTDIAFVARRFRVVQSKREL
jgi:phenylacetic acid degradation protein paaN